MAIRFRFRNNVGNHRMNIGGQMKKLQPGEIIEVEYESDLGNALDKFERLDPDPGPPEPTVGLVVKKRGDGDLDGYDVVREDIGERVNDGPLTKSEAFGMAKRDITIVDEFEDDAIDPTEDEED